MPEKLNCKNWRLKRDGDDIVRLYLDCPETPVNTLSRAVLEELDAVLNIMREAPPPRGLIILSAKSGGFITGADIREFTTLKSREEALGLIRRGQAVFDRLEALSFPTVALIHGFCLGGGLELALACRFRIAEQGARLGFPEVLLGIHPGFGGTVRLPGLVGAATAMDMILSGRILDARRAKKIGLVHQAVPSRQLESWARKAILGPLPTVRPSLIKRLSNHALLRPLISKALLCQVTRRAPSAHYPAPYAIIHLWSHYAGDPQIMLREEAASVAGLITGPIARNLARVFFLRERLKSLGRAEDFKVRHVHVIGAGVMGGDIAAWCALRGCAVTLQDREPRFIAPAVKRAWRLFQRRLKSPRLARQAMDRFTPDINGVIGLARADLVIEAIFEDVDAKRELFRDIESRVRPEALLATNTSSIPLEEISKTLANPERLVGIHFFNPVARMSLVEVIAGGDTDPSALKRAFAFARQIDRLPLAVKSGPGFLVNRVLMPYLMEAMILAGEGVSPERIDRAALAFGMPMGPLTLADTVGLDICLHVGTILESRLGSKVPARLREMVDSGLLGKKSGKGFYAYKRGKQIRKRPRKTGAELSEIMDRLMFRMFNEAMACLREGVIQDADLLDAGMIFGAGFAPFRGGVLRHCRAMGIPAMRHRLLEMEKKYGERFHPDAEWEKRSFPPRSVQAPHSLEPLTERERRAIRDFNGREFMESHLIFEKLWMKSSGEKRRYLQGIIQIGAGIIKIRLQPDRDSAMSLLQKGCLRLKEIDPERYEVDVLRLMADVEKLLRLVKALGPDDFKDLSDEALPLLHYKETETGP